VLPPVQPWLPSALVNAVVALIEGAPVSDYLRAAGVAIVATPALLALASWRAERREL